MHWRDKYWIPFLVRPAGSESWYDLPFSMAPWEAQSPLSIYLSPGYLRPLLTLRGNAQYDRGKPIEVTGLKLNKRMKGGEDGT